MFLILDPMQWIGIGSIGLATVMALPYLDHAPATNQETSPNAI